MVAALGLAACGTAPRLSSTQLRDRASTICSTASQAANAIPSPGLTDVGRFLDRGTAVLGPELSALRALHPGGAAGVTYEQALRSFAAELAAIARAADALRHAANPTTTVRSLQRELTPLESSARRAWTDLGISACLA